MAFETVQIQSSRNGGGPVVGYREDLAPGDVLVFSLTNLAGITGVQWRLLGRPEGSAAGGAGPEPIVLANALTASITVDADDGAFRKDGSYKVEATINPGSPGRVRKTVIVARLSGLTIPGPSSTLRSLRKLGGFEALEDTSVVAVVQGWATQLNRWLDYLRAVGTGAGGTTTLAATYAFGTTAFDQAMVLADAKGGGIVVDGAQVAFTGQSALRVNTAAGGPVVVDRATGRMGVGTASPAKDVHVLGSSPALRLARSGGVSIDIQNVTDELRFLNGAAVLARVMPTGGVRADLGLAVGTAPATNPVVSFGAGDGTPVSSSGEARIRYNSGGNAMEYSTNTGPWTPFAGAGSHYDIVQNAGTLLTQRNTLNFFGGLVAADNSGSGRTDVSTVLAATQIGFGSGSNTMTSGADLAWDNANKTLMVGAAGTSNPAAAAQFGRNSNGVNAVRIWNSNTGDAVIARLLINVGSADSTAGGQVILAVNGDNFVGSGVGVSNPKVAYLARSPAAGGADGPLYILNSSTVSGGDVVIATQTTGSVEGLRVLNAGQVQVPSLNAGGYVKAAVTTGQLSAVATIPGTDVGLTATQVGFGSPSNTLTGSASFTYVDGTPSTVAQLNIGDGTNATVGRIGFNSPAASTQSHSLLFQQVGTTYGIFAANRDGTATTGRVQLTWSMTPVSGGSGLDFFRVGHGNQPDPMIGAYPNTGDILLGGPNSGDSMTGSSTGGFVWLPLTITAMTGTPSLIATHASGGSPRARQPVVIDGPDKRLYWYDTATTTWRYAEFNDGALFTSIAKGYTPASGGGTTNFLRADGTWTAPPGSGGTVTNVFATLPLTSTGGTTPNIALNYDASTITLNGSNQIQRAALTGDVVAGAGSNSTTLANIPNDVPMVGDLLATAVAAPGTPSSGKARIYVDSTSKNLAVKNDAGTINHGAQSFTASAHQFATALANDGSWTTAQPSYSDISGSVPAITALTGDVTATGPGSAAASFRAGAALSILGRSANSSGAIADISAASNGDVLRVSSNTLGFGTIPESSVTNLVSDLASKLADPGNNGALYRTSSGVTAALNGTTGSVPYFGSTGVLSQDNARFFYDGAGRWGFGTNAPSSSSTISIEQSVAGTMGIFVHNPNAGAAAQAAILLQSAASTTYATTPYGILSSTDAAWTPVGAIPAGSTYLESNSSVSGNALAIGSVNGKVSIYTGTGRTEQVSVSNAGAVTVAGLAGTGTRLVSSTSTGVLDNATISSPITFSGGALGLTTPTSNRVLAGNSGGTGFVASDEIRISDASDQLQISQDGAICWVNGPVLTGANFELVRTFWSGNVFHMQAEKGGVGTSIRAMQFTSTAGVNIDDSLAINGSGVASNSSFVVGHITNSQRDHIALFVGGGTENNDGPTSDTMVNIFPSSSGITGGLTLGVVSTVRIGKHTYTQSSGGAGGSYSVAASLYIEDAVAMPAIGPGVGYTGNAYAIYVAAGTARFVDVTATTSFITPGTMRAGTAGPSFAFSLEASADHLAFFGGAGSTQQTGGAATAGGSYTATEQGMINRMYVALRGYGLLT